MARNTWYRLDNVGKFYSSKAGSPTQTVFRFSASLSHDIDPDALDRALARAIDAFPSFNVCLRSGMFWHYLERSDERPKASPETLPVCFGLHAHAKSVLFRTTYYRNRINLEMSHIVSDGRGTLDFFKAILSAYANERYGAKVAPLDCGTTDRQKEENSFDTYFERREAGSESAPKAYRLSGPRDVADPLFLEYHLSAAGVLGLARASGVSLTSYVIAAVVCAIRDQMAPHERNRAIRLDIPVDLRQFFESSSAKNFFGLAFVSYVPGDDDAPLDEVARAIQGQLKSGTRIESLKPRMNQMIALEKNVAVRLSPLFAKDLVLGVADRITAREVTTTVSSLGRIELDDQVAPYVESISVFTSTTGLNFVVCTFGDDLSIGISTAYASTDVVRNFCRTFSSFGLEGRINLSGRGTR